MKLPSKTSAILLAGGVGTRMQSTTPKQFLTLGEKPVALHSFELFLTLAEIDEIIVVCPPDSIDFFTCSSGKTVKFALPGKRRQDSVYSGLQEAENELICIHDAARPFINKTLVLRVLAEGYRYGAATVGMPLKFTVKEVGPQNFVKKTPDRKKIWEIQTPQVLHREILTQGFQYALHHHITVTDDVSLAELIGKQVKLVEGSYDNLKITVPSDLALANQMIPFLPQ